jgi:hypothetical protein
MEQKLDATHLRPGIVGRSVAVGIAAAGIGMGILLAAWGISLLWRYTPPEIAVRVANPELHIVQEEPFKVEQDRPFSVEQDKPFKVDQDQPFKVDQSRSSAINGNNKGPKTASGDIIRREVTVFSEVEHGSGQIVTGWNYKDGSGGAPNGQYCYYTAPNGDGSMTKVTIASDGVRLPPITASLVPNLEGALAKCQWWLR